jgi:hypothetical protein
MLGDAIAISFWPFTGLAAFVYFKIKSSHARIIFLVVLGLWIYLPLLFLFAISGFASMPIVFDCHFTLFVLGIYFLYVGLKGVANDSEAKRKVGTYVLGLTAVACLGLGTWYLGGDYLFPRTSIEGQIQSLRVQRNGSGRYRLPDEFIVEINGQDYKATKQLFTTLHTGETIHAKIGKGSGYIFGVIY